jgi:hypothetical protein
LIQLLIEKGNEVYMANFNKRYFGLVVLSLILFIGIFLIKEKCFAYSQNFDSYANNYQINNVSEWASSTNSCIVKNSYSHSSPNSIRSIINSEECVYKENIDNLTFYFNDISNYIGYGGGTISFYNGSSIKATIFCATVWPNLDVRLSVDGNSTSTIVGEMTNNTWEKLQIIFDYDNKNVSLSLNDNTPIVINSNLTQINLVNFISAGGNPDLAGIFFDNIETNDSFNYINLTNPEDASIQNKNIFYWAYNFTISSSSYAAYDSFDTQIEYIPPIAGATSTFIESNWYKPAVQPDTAYIIVYDQEYNIPLYLGNYTAGAYLIGLKNDTFDILASDFVNFTMSEGTTTAQTAWCSGLCNDLATSTSAWWPPFVCAGRYVICYAMYPHDLTKQMFWQAYSDFKLVFPFNIFFEITSTIDNVFASTTMASTTGSFGLPMIKKVGTTSQYYILPLLTSTTTANFLGNANANLLRFSLSSIIYAFYTVGIILILW